MLSRSRPADDLDLDGGPVDGARSGVKPSLADRLAAALPGTGTRRGFIGKAAVVASALAVDPLAFILKPGTAYAAVCGDSNYCGSGWSAFCCTVNGGKNSCPPGSFTAGWWKADNSSFCNNGPRYYIDCNATVPVQCSCRCASGTCDQNYVCCNQFRYGQCNTQIAAYGPVVCRMVTCTPPWQFDASCTTSSRTDNNTRGHNAPCNPEYQPPPPPPPVTNWLVAPGACKGADGRIEVFSLAADRSLQHISQGTPNGGWGGWSSFPGRAIGSPAVARNEDGRLEVFWVGDDGKMYHSWQWGTGWSPAVSLGGSWGIFAGVAAATNADGRLEIFVIGNDRRMYHNWQTSPNLGGDGWSGWFAFEGQWRGSPAATRNADGRLEVFAIAGNGQLYNAWQTAPNSGWSGFISQGGNLRLDNAPAAARNVSGKLEVFALGTDRRLYHKWQKVAGGAWEPGWDQLGTATWRGSPAAAENADGRLEVFIEGDDRQFWHNWQVAPDSPWFGWYPMGGTSL